MVAFARLLGFEKVSVTAVFDRPQASPDFYSVDNTPSAYVQVWDDRNLGKLDPVMQHCKYSSQAIVWNQNTYVAKGMGGLWEHQARYGYQHGIALAIHSIGGRHLFLGVDRDRPIAEPTNIVDKMILALGDFAAHIENTAYRIFNPLSAQDTLAEPLTRIEIESLRWSMDGKSAHDIAEIMNISDMHSNLHLTNAMRKLRCSTKYHAAIKAIRLGLFRQ